MNLYSIYYIPVYILCVIIFFLESKTYFSTKNSKIVPVQVVVLLYIHTVMFEIFQDELLD